MSRFIWLIRREIWEHKAIWVAPIIALSCLLLLTFRDITLSGIDQSAAAVHAMKINGGLVGASFLVMGVIAFFYALDSLYADRRDRSVLFWKSLPVSDAETVLSKLAVAIVVIPLIAVVTGLLAQVLFLVQDPLRVVSATGAVESMALPFDASVFLLGPVLFLGAVVWYAPLAGYLMLVSALALRGPFLWAVLPPVALALGEAVVLRTNVVGAFIERRLLGVFELVDGGATRAVAADGGMTINISRFDAREMLAAVASLPEVWLGVVAAVILVAGAMWIRRYRDETT